ncbi:hypothetical protein J4460_04885 [Candidatus Woesearchaeota archaeon]|nr:hypothetical protein [Candidatus Woesearchaeota archaeon]HIH37391.1 hypothetical protein [Candidatus Woesearchaeota archaeon]HIH48388.1 hypothetical protein [Candidatus Woesearchaeota archaeon]HIJ04231.1 hypothetical protein [Candidatus Woesearchaeota archaeon]
MKHFYWRHYLHTGALITQNGRSADIIVVRFSGSGNDRIVDIDVHADGECIDQVTMDQEFPVLDVLGMQVELAPQQRMPHEIVLHYSLPDGYAVDARRKYHNLYNGQ